MIIKRFSVAFGLAAAIAMAPLAGAMAAPLPVGRALLALEVGAITLAQSVKERDLPDLPAVDTGREPPPAARTGPPAPPPVPPPPRLTTRTPPPAATTTDDESGPPPREVPPPPSRTSRAGPPPPTRLHEPAPTYRAAPRTDEPPLPAAAPPPPRSAPPAYDDPPPRRVEAPRRAAPARPSFAANCTQQCHLSCEASFEACNGDASPAKPACVKKLESCRIERCSCRIE